jgi:hypothetical protein
VTTLGEISPFGQLFKGPGKFLWEIKVCCRYFKSLEVVGCRSILLSNLALMMKFWHFLIWKLFGLLFSKIWATFSKIWASFSQSSSHPAAVFLAIELIFTNYYF